ncbi:MAG: hypothetical protein QNI96_05095 [Woeseiaceae bacterium]|nr:hypothetical protein [Woeseiaceae bacterium]
MNKLTKNFKAVLATKVDPNGPLAEPMTNYQTFQKWLAHNNDPNAILRALRYEAQNMKRLSIMRRLLARYNQLRLEAEMAYLTSIAEEVPRGRRAS